MAFIQMNLLSKSLMRTVPVNVILPVDKMVFPGMPEQFDFQVSYLEIGWDYERMEHAQIVDSTGSGLVSYRSLQIYLSCENTIRWMLDNGLMTEDSMMETAKYYGFNGPTEVFETVTK